MVAEQGQSPDGHKRVPEPGQQPHPVVEDPEVKAKGAEPGVGEPGQPDKAANKQRDHPAKQDAVGHGQVPLSSARGRRSILLAWRRRGAGVHHHWPWLLLRAA